MLHLDEGSARRPPESVHSEVDPVHAVADPTLWSTSGEERSLRDNISINDLSDTNIIKSFCAAAREENKLHVWVFELGEVVGKIILQ